LYLDNDIDKVSIIDLFRLNIAFEGA
jgi:hypothetical protein